MAERWQQWMPFHIDRWKGSAHVQAMRSSARCGYLYLLSSAWQSDDCSLPDDQYELQVMSGLTVEEWAEHGGIILRRFQRRADGRLANAVLQNEWSEAKRVFEARKKSAERTNRERSAHGDRDGDRRDTARRPLRRADTQTGTGTDTETKTETQKPSRARREGESDSRHAEFREACRKYAEHKGVQFVWNASEGKALADLLGAAPQFTLADFQKCLQHRAKSKGVPHGDRPRVWLPHILRFQTGPLDQFGKIDAPAVAAPAPSREKTTALLGREEQERKKIVDEWRAVQGHPEFSEAPQWVKERLAAETATHNPAA